MRWDIFCRVIDNLGDIGVCWRLACDLAGRGESPRLWVDDASALAWMAPGGDPGVEVIAWQEPPPMPEPGDVVIEAFGCDPPSVFVDRMAKQARPPCWINLEYLSAEAYVERSHGLPSPQSNGLTKWFFYPGFTRATGGLIREPGLLARQQDFDALAWLRAHAVEPLPGERMVSLFCYPNAALPELIDALSTEPTLLLVTGGITVPHPASMRVFDLPMLTQRDYDHLLWSCDINCVRGEDSFVRAQWAGKPMLWQAYRQDDGAHHAKVDAFLDRMLRGAEVGVSTRIRRLHAAWNQRPALAASFELPEVAAWRATCKAWRDSLAGQDDLATRLIRFVAVHG